MRNKKAKAIRRLAGCDLGRGSEDRQQGYVSTGKKYIGILSHDNNHSYREEDVLEARTTEERYLYRQMKKVYRKYNFKPTLRETLISDIKQMEAKK